MNNINIKFECESSKYMELRNERVWVAIHNKLVIMKNKRSRRKEKWVQKLVAEIQDITDYYDVILNREEEYKIVIDFIDFNLIGGIGYSQEECCNDVFNLEEPLKKVMRKFNMENYIFTYNFEPSR